MEVVERSSRYGPRSLDQIRLIPEMFLMICVLVAFAFLQSPSGFAYCNTATRFDNDILECGWKPNQPSNSRIYSAFEKDLERAVASREDIDGLYQVTINHRTLWKERYYLWKKSVKHIAALTLLESAAKLDTKECLDHCTFVLAKNNCNAAMSLHACQPLSTAKSYIKAMLEAKVFPLMKRCQLPLMHQAVVLNSTVIDPRLYMTVEYIADLMTSFKPSDRWKTVDEMISKSRRPFLASRRVIRPAEAAFFDNLAETMVNLERRAGGRGLVLNIAYSDIPWVNAKSHYDRLILRPCRHYIKKMHTAMDATIFYGRIMDLDRSRFSLEVLQDDSKIAYFKLLRMYEACMYLDNEVYTVEWRARTKQMIDRGHLL